MIKRTEFWIAFALIVSASSIIEFVGAFSLLPAYEYLILIFIGQIAIVALSFIIMIALEKHVDFRPEGDTTPFWEYRLEVSAVIAQFITLDIVRGLNVGNPPVVVLLISIIGIISLIICNDSFELLKWLLRGERPTNSVFYRFRWFD